jgi:hypothetical protein
MISEALQLFELPNPSGTLESSSLMISEALGLFEPPNPCASRDSISLIFLRL